MSNMNSWNAYSNHIPFVFARTFSFDKLYDSCHPFEVKVEHRAAKQAFTPSDFV